jgi:outer membrane protein assembly factor BamA
MYFLNRFLWSTCLILSVVVTAMAQTVRIASVTISGNLKTRNTILLREMTLQVGDTLDQKMLKTKLAECKRNITNTQLFNQVTVQLIDSTAQALSIEVKVKERWYFYPIPVVELADRNFNVWWVERNHDLRRLNAGVFLIKRNLRGRNETLTGVFEVGYTNFASLQYDFPYIDKQMRKGLQLYSSFYSNKESAYATDTNKLLFLRDDNHYLKLRSQTGAIFRYRKAINVRHNLEINYTTYSITDTLLKANYHYLLNGKKYSQFALLRYSVEIDYRDSKAYPLNGYYFMGQLTRWGLTPWDNVNMSEASILTSKYTAIGHRFYLFQSLKVKTSYPSAQPYNLQRGLGYLTDYVRGYEYYVIDGQHFGILRNEIKYQLVKKSFTSLYDKFDNLPFNLFLKAFVDIGYAKDQFYFKNNPLNNQLLSGYGIGLDIATFYDMVFRYEITTNHLKETRLYFSLRAAI